MNYLRYLSRYIDWKFVGAAVLLVVAVLLILRFL